MLYSDLKHVSIQHTLVSHFPFFTPLFPSSFSSPLLPPFWLTPPMGPQPNLVISLSCSPSSLRIQAPHLASPHIRLTFPNILSLSHLSPSSALLHPPSLLFLSLLLPLCSLSFSPSVLLSPFALEFLQLHMHYVLSSSPPTLEIKLN